MLPLKIPYAATETQNSHIHKQNKNNIFLKTEEFLEEVSVVIYTVSMPSACEEEAASAKSLCLLPPMSYSLGLRADHRELIWPTAAAVKMTSCLQAPSVPSRCHNAASDLLKV